MLTTSLFIFAALYAAGLARAWKSSGVDHAVRGWQALSFLGGWLTLVVALLSPLHQLSETSFAAHMVQHELLMVIAAPLVAFGSPLAALAWTFSRGPRRSLAGAMLRSLGVLPTAIACGLHALALWVWHAPALYDAALAHEGIHALQHLSFFGTGVLFWWIVAHGHYGRVGYGAGVLYLFATSMQSGLLGALITLSTRIWYAPYTPYTTWGLTAIEDQQMAGLIMWIPATVVFTGAGLALLVAWLRESTRRVERYGPTRHSAV